MRTQLEHTVAQIVANRCILAERIMCTYNLRWFSSIQWSSWNNYIIMKNIQRLTDPSKLETWVYSQSYIFIRLMTRVFMTWMHTFVAAVIQYIHCKPTGDGTQIQNWIKCRMGCLLLQHFRHMWCLYPPWHSCRPSLLSTRFRCLQRIQWRQVPGDRAVQAKLRWGPHDFVMHGGLDVAGGNGNIWLLIKLGKVTGVGNHQHDHDECLSGQINFGEQATV